MKVSMYWVTTHENKKKMFKVITATVKNICFSQLIGKHKISLSDFFFAELN